MCGCPFTARLFGLQYFPKHASRVTNQSRKSAKSIKFSSSEHSTSCFPFADSLGYHFHSHACRVVPFGKVSNKQRDSGNIQDRAPVTSAVPVALKLQRTRWHVVLWLLTHMLWPAYRQKQRACLWPSISVLRTQDLVHVSKYRTIWPIWGSSESRRNIFSHHRG